MSCVLFSTLCREITDNDDDVDLVDDDDLIADGEVVSHMDLDDTENQSESGMDIFMTKYTEKLMVKFAGFKQQNVTMAQNQCKQLLPDLEIDLSPPQRTTKYLV